MKIGRFFNGRLALAGFLVLLAGWAAIANFAPQTSRAGGPTASVFSWGANSFGQLGDGTTTDHNAPVALALPTGVSAVSLNGGYEHSQGIGSDGKIYTWGINGFGELGDGTTNSHYTPTAITLPGGVSPIAIAAGSGLYDHSLAIGSDGNLYAWGANDHGQLGDGTFATRYSPVLVKLPAGVKARVVAAGSQHSLAIGSDGNLYVWGDNQYGQIGNGTSGTGTSFNSPTLVSLPGGVKATAISGGFEDSMAVGNDGNIYAWGYNSFGQLGIGTFSNIEANPVRTNLPAGVKATAISAGSTYSLALGNDGNVYSWGSNNFGELGDGTTNQRSNPGLVSLPAGVKARTIAAGGGHSLLIGTDNNLYAWGYNGKGQLGDGTNTNRPSPVVIKLPGGQVPTGIGTGMGQSFAIVQPVATVTININNVSHIEGNGNVTPFTFTVSLAAATSQPVSVNFATADGMATLADRDYQAASGTLTFAPGETSKTITVLVNGDTKEEPDETFMVKLSNPVGATLGQAVGVGTILNDDGESGEADLVCKLRVTPDREYDLSGQTTLNYLVTVQNIGPGPSSAPAVQLPIDSNLTVAYAAFSSDSTPGAFYEKTVTDNQTAVLPMVSRPYAQLRLPALQSGQAVTATIAMRAAPGAKAGSELTTRCAVIWDNLDGKTHHHYSNRVHLRLSADTNRNETGGLVQSVNVSGEGNGLDNQGRALVRLQGDIFAPGERVELWYTDAAGKSNGLGYVWADQNTGEVNAELTISGWQSGQRYFLAALGDRTGVIGSATILVEAKRYSNHFSETTQSGAGYTFTSVAPLFSGKDLQNILTQLTDHN